SFGRDGSRVGGTGVHVRLGAVYRANRAGAGHEDVRGVGAAEGTAEEVRLYARTCRGRRQGAGTEAAEITERILGRRMPVSLTRPLRLTHTNNVLREISARYAGPLNLWTWTKRRRYTFRHHKEIAMRFLGRILGAFFLVLSTVGILCCAAGIFGIWIGRPMV